MSFKDYSSVTHISRNERGHEEIRIERHRTFLQWLFSEPATEERYERYFGIWVVKGTGKELNAYYENEISIIIRKFKYIQSFDRTK